MLKEQYARTARSSLKWLKNDFVKWITQENEGYMKYKLQSIMGNPKKRKIKDTRWNP